jgi:deazaflavin-dependent oxidoreductase (nitroreductase family)
VTASLPYGPAVTAVLNPLREAFLVLNRWAAAPLIRTGGGPLLTTRVAGSILLLRTTGRTSGLIREAPLGYTVINGRVVVVAGYGRGAHWFRNATANPEVEVLLPGARIAGRAEEITEPAELRATFRALIASMGVVGRLTLGDVRGRSDAEVDTLALAFPILAITPTAVRPGPFDPGGVGTRINTALSILLTAAGLAAAMSRHKRLSRHKSAPHQHTRSRHETMCQGQGHT